MAGYVQTELKAINELMGGLPVGTMCGLSGAPEAGKTICTIQFAMETIKARGGNAFILDTEGSSFTYNDWVGQLNKRYGINAEVVPVFVVRKELKEGVIYELKPEKRLEQHAIYVLDKRALVEILPLLGRGANITNADSGKFLVKVDPNHWEDDITLTPIGKFVTKHALTYMALDSVNYPLLIFGSNQENNPARAQVTAWIMGAMQQYASHFNLVQFGVMHHSVNDQDSFQRPKVLGGKNVHASYKFIMYMNREQSTHTPPAWKKRPKTVREVRLLRHPSRPPWEKDVYMDLTDSGYVDIEAPSA